jgi:hypothetical protein
MQKRTARNDEVTPAVSAYLAASEAALSGAQRLNEAWRHYFESNGEAPSAQWVAEVAALQMTSEMALLHARAVAKEIASPSVVAGGSEATTDTVVVKTRRRRRRENKFLASIGRPGKRLLRVALIIALVVSTLVATGAGISLALEFAGFLHLIDDPVQLPVGIQLAIFIAATGLAFGFRRVLKPVDRALYGSKGLRPKGFTL